MARITTAIALGLAGSLLLAGCVKPRSSEEAVTARIDARYAALIAQDYEKAYRYYTPGLREVNSLETMAARLGRVKYLAARVVQLECPSAETCQAEVEVTFDWEGKPVMPRGPKMGKITSVKPEKWIKVDGDWYLYVDR
jgi:hypothetical protein